MSNKSSYMLDTVLKIERKPNKLFISFMDDTLKIMDMLFYFHPRHLNSKIADIFCQKLCRHHLSQGTKYKTFKLNYYKEIILTPYQQTLATKKALLLD